jgi:hypothetical protein
MASGMTNPGAVGSETSGDAPETAVVVVFFDDIKSSTVLKERMAAASDEQAFRCSAKSTMPS